MKKVLMSCLLVISCISFSQEEKKTDSISKKYPIAFFEAYAGIGGVQNDFGWVFGGNLNYQFYNTNLLTARLNFISASNASNLLLFPTAVYPLLKYGEIREEQVEGALLYGKRWVNKGVSFSVSGGISYVYRQYPKEEANYWIKETQRFLGFPWN